mmetsp:Transcript_2302/g.3631  ORF Transcript_2302/g.3631 Transcript_2302/m.3631 type:complete len:359 (-) Transcript_2302:103-1179(-)
MYKRKENPAGEKPKKKNKKQKQRDAINIHGIQRKLLVFDVNKVLVFRHARTSYFKLRPHVAEFLTSMAQRYQLAVWTSMTKKSAKPVMDALFHMHEIPFLFCWCQNRCLTVPNEDVPSGKPLFLKDLSYIWKEYPSYNESNTILVDDTEDKCVLNNAYNCIHPKPYNGDFNCMSTTGSISDRSTPHCSMIADATGNTIGVDRAISSNQQQSRIERDSIPNEETGICGGKVSDNSTREGEDNVNYSSSTHIVAVTRIRSSAGKFTADSINTTNTSRSHLGSVGGVGSITDHHRRDTVDHELQRGSSLWLYLDRISMEQRTMQELFDLYGPYQTADTEKSSSSSSTSSSNCTGSSSSSHR